jgi:hypothetical protein
MTKSSQVSVQARKLELHKSDVQDNFRTAIDTLQDCNMVEHHRNETICEDAY